MKPPYSWRCQACDTSNPAGVQRCQTCDCSCTATHKEIEEYKPKPSQEELEKLAQNENWYKEKQLEAEKLSGYKKYHYGSIVLFLLSLSSPDFSGIFLLLFGWIGFSVGFSAAWFANPLLILAFFLAKPGNDPWKWRWYVYIALAFMATTPIYELEEINIFDLIFPFLWATSAVLLIIGLHFYRRKYIEILQQNNSRNAQSTPQPRQ